jgi:hypothetical protein
MKIFFLKSLAKSQKKAKWPNGSWLDSQGGIGDCGLRIADWGLEKT